MFFILPLPDICLHLATLSMFILQPLGVCCWFFQCNMFFFDIFLSLYSFSFSPQRKVSHVNNLVLFPLYFSYAYDYRKYTHTWIFILTITCKIGGYALLKTLCHTWNFSPSCFSHSAIPRMIVSPKKLVYFIYFWFLIYQYNNKHPYMQKYHSAHENLLFST